MKDLDKYPGICVIWAYQVTLNADSDATADINSNYIVYTGSYMNLNIDSPHKLTSLKCQIESNIYRCEFPVAT